ncbi:MAG: aldehyde dehydrogenase family protein [Dehalococcoidia bacterium]|nr:aldehyde dehydrogenase family protein [Dehalococcoidia bacterium]
MPTDLWQSQSVDSAMQTEQLTRVTAGMPLVFGGDRVAFVPAAVAEAFRAGDRLLVVQSSGEILHAPAAQWRLAEQAVSGATSAFQQVSRAGAEQITDFYDRFAANLRDEASWERVVEVNALDIEAARARGRSTTRLVADGKMRGAMIAGLETWRDMPNPNGVSGSVQHEGWRIEQVRAGYGVVGFVFEGRPNVLADGAGVLRSGNTAVMRIGSDALGTARALVELALRPALEDAGLPPAAVTLLDSAEHAAGWALFSDPRLGLAVARGSGESVLLLGSLARQAGIPVSMHGTGGAWIIADESASPGDLQAAVFHSTDRKVCNSLNTVCLPAGRVQDLAKVVVAALEERGQALGHGYRLHVARGSEDAVPSELFQRVVRVMRAAGEVEEPLADLIDGDQLGREWEWEQTPEVTLKVVASVDEAVELFNEQSPRFIASLISNRRGEHERFFAAIDAGFVGNGFTRCPATASIRCACALSRIAPTSIARPCRGVTKS